MKANMNGQVAIASPSAKSRNLRGQVATEFFIYAGVFLIMVIAATTVIQFSQNSEMANSESIVAKENGQRFADAIHIVQRGGPGFSYMLEYPSNILGYPFLINLGSGAVKDAVYMTWEGPRGNVSFVYRVESFTNAEFFDMCNDKIDRRSGIINSNSGDSFRLNITNTLDTNHNSKLVFRQECK